jgi:hypothetical protein
MMKTVESVVKSRYAAGAQASETSLCCPVEYDEDLLRVLPREVVSAGALHEAVEKAIIDVPLAEAKPFDCSRTSTASEENQRRGLRRDHGSQQHVLQWR